MKKKCLGGIVAISLAGGATGMDVMAYLESRGWFETVSVVPTHMAFTFKDSGSEVHIFLEDAVHFQTPPLIDNSNQYVGKNEPFVLSEGRTVCFASGHPKGGVRFTPASFKDGRKGFRVSELYNVVFHVGYIALGGASPKAEEADVEQILVWKRTPESGVKLHSPEWKTPEEIVLMFAAGDESTVEPRYVVTEKASWEEMVPYDREAARNPNPDPKEEGGATASPPSRESVQPAAVETPPEPPAVPTPEPVEAQAPVLENGTPDIADGEDGQSEEKSKTNNLWLYALIPLFAFFVILYFIRRRPKI